MAIFSTRVTQSNDNGNENYGTGAWSMPSVFLGSNNPYFSNQGLRFLNITIPKGSKINSAILEFTAYSNQSSNSVNTIIYGAAYDNFSGFSNSVLPSNITKTAANVLWTPNAWTQNNTFDTPDISSIVGEIINRAGWNSGNAMAFALNDNISTVNAYRNGYYSTTFQTTAPLLTINYTLPSNNNFFGLF